jgi:hypothetical protein
LGYKNGNWDACQDFTNPNHDWEAGLLTQANSGRQVAFKLNIELVDHQV